MKIVSFLVGVLWCLPSFSQTKLVYQDETKPLEVRVEDALSRMTLEEKVRLLHANGGYRSWGVPRLGIPDNNPTDGPTGLRPEMRWENWEHAGANNDSCTAFPAMICLAATWNPQMGELYGKAYSEEALYRNKNIILGPGVNIFRTPLNGRNFEYMGEDPYLASQMAVGYIQGVQSNHVAACVKHFAVNNQETNRYNINTIVDERTLHEIYLPAFKAAVQKGHVWTIMGAYNQYNGQHCCHNSYLLQDILRKKWKFDGVVLSDFGGTHDTKEAVLNGLDLEYGTSLGSPEAFDQYYLANPYLDMIRQGKIGQEELNQKVRNVLRMMFRTSLSGNRPWGSLASPEHAAVARRVAEEGIVLLQNNGKLLPLNVAQYKHILVVGENAVTKMALAGGSSEVRAKYEVTVLEGIRKKIGEQSQVAFTMGYSSAKNADAAKLRADAVAAARQADVVIYVGGLNKSPGQDCEGADRESLILSYGQDELLKALSEANSKIVAVMLSGNPYTLPWKKQVPAILQAWYGGSEAGTAIASVLIGEVNPSGKLPFSFPVKLEDIGAHACNAYPGDGKTVEYKEGIFVGYRWLEHNRIKPVFAFGHGLSYTDFAYSNLVLDKKQLARDEKLAVKVTVKNIGKYAGAEVIQVYISDLKSTLPRPVKELKEFKKIYLQPGETKEVTFVLDREAFSFYNPAVHDWVVEPGKFKVSVGSSSADIRLQREFTYCD